MECIYYKGRSGLTEKGQEHIFPAGLGGIKKLPKGYVSYEANNYFSKLENHLMHGSLVMLHRSLFGPSKRKDKKEGKRIITVFEGLDTDESSRVELGYMREGTPYVITQVCILKDHMIFTHSLDGGKEELEVFIEKLKTEEERIIRKTSTLVKDKTVIIGYSQKTVYVAINPDNDISDDTLRALMKKAAEIYTSNHQIQYKQEQITSHIDVSETMGDYRVFGKIAFNVLSDIKGKDYVLDSDFDKFRNWLMGAEDKDYAGFLPGFESKTYFPENSHWCVFCNIRGDLWATVGLYNSFTRSMKIAKGRGTDFNFVDGMICDWKNEKEYSLLEYITHMSDNIMDGCQQPNK